MERSAWAWMPATALLLCGVDLAPCAAQPPLPPSSGALALDPATSPGGPARPNPLATDLKLKAAPLEPTDVGFPIDLATALRLSDARPLVVAAAQAGVWVAEADLNKAKVLWIPTLN